MGDMEERTAGAACIVRDSWRGEWKEGGLWVVCCQWWWGNWLLSLACCGGEGGVGEVAMVGREREEGWLWTEDEMVCGEYSIVQYCTSHSSVPLYRSGEGTTRLSPGVWCLDDSRLCRVG